MAVNAFGGSGENQSRDSACTPKWLADLIGEVGLDPCSNPRAHIQAMWKVRLDLGGDGLGGTLAGEFLWGSLVPPILRQKATADWVVYCNPPYARGQVIRWVRHYKHTRFIFLLRYDPSTEWFEELIARTDYVWFPRRRRIEFEPPPGVKFSSNPFPHALFLRDPSPDLLERLRASGYLLDARLVRGQTAANGQHRLGADVGGENQGAAEPADGGGAGAGASGEGEACQECTRRKRKAARFRRFAQAKGWIAPGQPAGSEVPGAAPQRQRVRRNRRSRAASDVSGSEVGAERPEGEGDGGIQER